MVHDFVLLLMDVLQRWAIGSIEDGRDDFVQFVVIDTFDVSSASCSEDGIQNVAAHDGHNTFSGAFLCTNDGLADRIQPVGFFVGLGELGDSGRSWWILVWVGCS